MCGFAVTPSPLDHHARPRSTSSLDGLLGKRLLSSAKYVVDELEMFSLSTDVESCLVITIIIIISFNLISCFRMLGRYVEYHLYYGDLTHSSIFIEIFVSFASNQMQSAIFFYQIFTLVICVYCFLCGTLVGVQLLLPLVSMYLMKV